MSKYKFDVIIADVDCRDQMHFHSLFGVLQESAARNAEDFGWGASTMDRENAAWVILRMSVRMKRRPEIGETILVETWSRGYKRLYFFRDFLIYSMDKELIGKATSMWIAIDKTSRRPLRPQRFDKISEKASIDRTALFEQPIMLEPLSKLFSADDERMNRIVKHADYSEIDRNLHVNNTRYVAWSMDAANYNELMNCDILSADINYICEIKHKEKVDVFFVTEGSEVRVDGVISQTGKLAFSCKLGVAGISENTYD